MPDELNIGRDIFRRLRLAGCGFNMDESGRIGTTGATPDPEILSQANANYHALGFAISEVTALEGLLRRRLGEGSSGVTIARAILEKDPANDLAILTLRDAPDSAGAIYDCLRGMGLTVARSSDDPEKVSIEGPATTLATACGPLMKQAVAEHRTALLARIDRAAVEVSRAADGIATALIHLNESSTTHAIAILSAASNSGLGLRQTSDGHVEVYGQNAERVDRFAFDVRDGLDDVEMQSLAALLDEFPIEPRRKRTAFPE